MKKTSGFIRGDGGIIISFKLSGTTFVAKYVNKHKPALLCSFDNDGLVDGEAVQYYLNGKPYIIMNFSHGHLEGAQRAYTLKGEQGIGHYKSGELVECDSVYASVTTDIPVVVNNVDIKYILDHLRDFADDIDDLED